MPSLESPHADAVLSAHCHQRDSNDCAPFSAAMILNGVLDARVDPEALARELDRPRMGGLAFFLPLVRRVPRSATFPWGIVDVLRQHGRRSGDEIDARWRILAGPDALLSGLAQGHLLMPYIGGYRPKPWGHVVVLLAWDEERGWGVADPQLPRAEMSWMSDEVFRRKRKAMGGLLVTARINRSRV